MAVHSRILRSLYYITAPKLPILEEGEGHDSRDYRDLGLIITTVNSVLFM
jgi:hypothetical protein